MKVFIISLLVIFTLILCSFNVYAQWSATNPLPPTGDPEQDYTNLQDCINHSNLDESSPSASGHKLYLGEGIFKVHKMIIRDSDKSFKGTIIGKGKGKTIIRAVRGVDNVPFEPSEYPALFSIKNASFVGVSDLTFQSNGSICDEWEYGGEGGLPTKGLCNYIVIENGEKPLDTDLNNVEFNGSRTYVSYGIARGIVDFGDLEIGDYAPIYETTLENPNVLGQGFPWAEAFNPEIVHLFEIYTAGPGTHNVKSCTFSHGLLGMLEFAFVDGPQIYIGGSPATEVIFEDGIENSIELWRCSNFTAHVSFVKTKNATGFYSLGHKEDNKLSRIQIRMCDINLRQNSWASAGINIITGSGKTRAIINGNILYNYTPRPISEVWGTIYTSGVYDLEIKDNTLKGKGPFAIYTQFESWPERLFISNNHLDEWDNNQPSSIWGPRSPKIGMGFKDNLNLHTGP